MLNYLKVSNPFQLFRATVQVGLLAILIVALPCISRATPTQNLQKQKPNEDDLFTQLEPGVRILGKPSHTAVLGQVLDFIKISESDFVLVTSDGVKIWNNVKNKVKKAYAFDSRVDSCKDFRFSKNKQLFAISTWSFANADPNQPGRVLVFDSDLNLESEFEIADQQKENTNGLNQVTALEFSPDDLQLAVSTWTGLKVIDLGTEEVVQEFKWAVGSPAPWRIWFEEDQIIALGRRTKVFDLNSGVAAPVPDSLKSLTKHFVSVHSENSNRLFFSVEEMVKVVDLADGKEKEVESIGPVRTMLELYLSPDEKMLGAVYLGDHDSKDPNASGVNFSVIDTETLELKYRIKGIPGRPAQIRWDDSNQAIFVAYHNSTGFQRLSFDESKVEQNPVFELNKPIGSMLLSADGSKLSASFSNAPGLIFDWKSGKSHRDEGFYIRLFSSTLSDRFFGISQQGLNFELMESKFKPARPTRVARFSMKQDAAGPLTGFVFGMSDRPVGKYYYVYPSAISVNKTKTELHCVVLDGQKGIRIQSFEVPGYKRTGSKLFKRKPIQTPLSSTAITSDGELFAIHESGKLKIVEIETEQTLVELPAKSVSNIFFGPDDDWLAMVTDKAITIFETETGDQLKKIEASDPLVSLARDSSHLLVTSKKRASPVRIFETKNWSKILEHKTATVDRTSATISNDGKRIAMGLSNCCFELWEIDKLRK